MWDTVWILWLRMGPSAYSSAHDRGTRVCRKIQRMSRCCATAHVTRSIVRRAIGAVKIGLPCETLPSPDLNADNWHTFVAFTVHVSTVGTTGLHPFRSMQHDTSCISTSPLVWEAITGIPYPFHQIECDAIIGKQTHQKGWSTGHGSCHAVPLRRVIMQRKFTKGPLRAIFYIYIHTYMMFRLSLVHISREMILHFGKIIPWLICDVAHLSSCSSIEFIWFRYWLCTK